MKVLIIPEDQALDGFIIKPIIERIFADLGRRAFVEVLPEPRLRGAAQALDASIIADIVKSRAMFDLFVLVVDRDCNRMKNQEKAEARAREHPDRLVVCLAVEEVETWMLALHRDDIGASWSDVRAECDPKERFAEPLLDRLGRRTPGRGRKGAMRDIGSNWKSLLRLCPELAELKEALATHKVIAS